MIQHFFSEMSLYNCFSVFNPNTYFLLQMNFATEKWLFFIAVRRDRCNRKKIFLFKSFIGTHYFQNSFWTLFQLHYLVTIEIMKSSLFWFLPSYSLSTCISNEYHLEPSTVFNSCVPPYCAGKHFGNTYWCNDLRSVPWKIIWKRKAKKV